MKELPLVEGCALTPADLAEQAGRAARLRAALVSAERTPDNLRITFSASVDVSLIAELVETERSCCPFFALDYDADERVLSVGIADAARRPALDAVAAAFCQ
jgi:hypothetical protein